jgi:hypothetical protein
MYVARKNVLENREITLILKGEMSFATETSLGVKNDPYFFEIVVNRAGCVLCRESRRRLLVARFIQIAG